MAPVTPIERLLRDLTAQVLSRLLARGVAFDAAEDALQEALLVASRKWPEQGVPEKPAAWLVRVAQRRVTDEARAELARRRREDVIVMMPEPSTSDGDELVRELGDDTLALVFLCCHPVLPRSSAIALTLRAVGGLTTAEIAAAYMVPESTMAQRISRAKATLREAGASFESPDVEERDERMATVLHTLYLVFNEGYASGGQGLLRNDLCDEAIRLVRLLARTTEEPEVRGLLALLLLTHARRHARLDEAGELVPLDRQDRALWERVAIDEGRTLLEAVLPLGRVGPYQLQAAIAALHDEADSTETTDWPQILALYELLVPMAQSPVVKLNHAVALAMVEGPTAGLARLAELERDARLARGHRLLAVRAHLLERAGQAAAARDAFERAAELTPSPAEQNYLRLQAARLREEVSLS